MFLFPVIDFICKCCVHLGICCHIGFVLSFACFNPNTVLAHCSYAANSYYQRNAQNQQACDFAGTAQLSPTDPSQPGCTFPATPRHDVDSINSHNNCSCEASLENHKIHIRHVLKKKF